MAPPPPSSKNISTSANGRQVRVGPAGVAVKHVVVLMLENRSFDSILGWLYDGKDTTPDGQPFNGLKDGMTLPDKNGNQVPVKRGAAPTDPPLDPGEPFPNVVHQMYGQEWDPAHPVDLRKEPEMKGFLLDFEKELDEAIHQQQQARQVKALAGDDPDVLGQLKQDNFRYNEERDLTQTPRAAYLHAFTPDQVPVLAGLAREYACSDTYHCSVPTQTFPNRSFMAAATSGGIVTNTGFEEDPHTILQRIGEHPTLYNQFQQAGVSWNIFYHDLSFAVILHIHQLKEYVDPALGYCRQMNDFFKMAAAGTLPAYSFIEPRYFPNGNKRHNNNYNDHHPEDIWRAAHQKQDNKPGVWQGEDLVLSIYEALVNGPNWENTLLIINYDEHGGTYDHAPPPRATPPQPGATPMPPHCFGFHRYGVRVPCIMVSPWIRRGRVLRPPYPDDPPFDHTSILKSARQCFAPELPCLSERDRDAPTILHVLDEQAVRRDGQEIAQRIRKQHDTLRPATGVDLSRRDIKALGIGPDDFWAQALNLFAEFRSQPTTSQVPAYYKDPWGRVRAMVRTIALMRPQLLSKNEKSTKQYKSAYHAMKAVHQHGLFLPEPPSDDEGSSSDIDSGSEASDVSQLTDDETFPRQEPVDLSVAAVQQKSPTTATTTTTTAAPTARTAYSGTVPVIQHVGEPPMSPAQARGRAYQALHRAQSRVRSHQFQYLPHLGIQSPLGPGRAYPGQYVAGPSSAGPIRGGLTRLPEERGLRPPRYSSRRRYR